VIINGESHKIDEPRLLKDVLDNLSIKVGSVAVAINQKFVPLSDYEKTWLGDDDVLDIVTPMQGG